MKIIWEKPIDITRLGVFIGTLELGHTQAVANWYTVRSLQGGAATIMSYLNSFSEGAAERPIVPGVPETEELEISGTHLAFIRGVLPGYRYSTRGTLTGKYRIILCHTEDVLEVLAEYFDYKQVVSRRLSA